MPAPVPFGDLAREGAALEPALCAAFARVVRSGWFVLGAEVEAFETELAAWLGAGRAVGCASGTDAITLALRALDVGAGDEVITAANTCGPTAVGIENAGARLRLVDADPETLLLDAAQLAAAITPRTRAVVPVHLYGGAADMDAIGAAAARHGVAVVEDCAQSHGSEWNGRRTGTFGAIAAFSFYPSKNLGALGDGGAIVTDDGGLAERARMLRNLGQATKGEHLTVAGNDRLDGIQAAFLRAKLGRLDEWNESRCEHAMSYVRLLGGEVSTPTANSDGCVHHLFPVRLADRDGIAARLRERGVETGIHYSPTAAWQPPFETAPGAFPAAERWQREELSLPMFPELRPDQVERVAATLLELLA